MESIIKVFSIESSLTFLQELGTSSSDKQTNNLCTQTVFCFTVVINEPLNFCSSIFLLWTSIKNTSQYKILDL